MQLQPVKQYREARFPSKAEVDSSAEILRNVPQRWQRNAAVCALLLGMGMLAVPQSAIAAPETAPVVARIAPLFPYPGMLDRQMKLGRIVVPKFLDEEEARAIILEEAEKAGISFASDKQVLQAPMPVQEKTEDGTMKFTIKDIPVTFDGTDSARNISFEFVSEADIKEWSDQGVTTVGMNSAAEMLRDGLSQRVPTGSYAVFYDPASMKLQGFQGVELRQQVQEFIIWLKTEGVI